MAYLYRYDSYYSSEYSVTLYCKEYRIIKETPRGHWVEIGFSSKRFVLKDARKRFACSTKEEALESFRARKRRQIGILRHQLRLAEAALKAEPEIRFYYDEIES